MHASGSPTRARLSLVALLAAALAATVMVPAAHAQYSGRTMALSAFGGYNVASDIYSTQNVTIEMKNGFEWGGRLTGITGNRAGVEFAYTRNGADLAVKSGIPVNGFKTGKITSDQYDLNFLISQPGMNPRMWPYFTLGFGWTVTHPEYQDLSNKTVTGSGNSLFAFNFGIGSLVEMNPKLALRLDARWRVTDTAITTSSGVYCDYWGYCWGYASDWYNSGEFTGGLTYRLGGR